MTKYSKRTLIVFLFLIISILSLENIGCKFSTSPVAKPDSTSSESGPIVRKPNIYIYPESKINIVVMVEFPNGGHIIESIPQYKNGWDVTVEPSGKIDNTFDFLFYECTAPDLYQYRKAWIVEHDSLLNFFITNLSESGFNENEIFDFTEYWIPKLQGLKKYAIFPQYYSELQNIVRLKFSKRPKNLLRLFYIIKDSNNLTFVPETPDIPKYDRSGFHVAEWGVIVSDKILQP